MTDHTKLDSNHLVVAEHPEDDKLWTIKIVGHVAWLNRHARATVEPGEARIFFSYAEAAHWRRKNCTPVTSTRTRMDFAPLAQTEPEEEAAEPVDWRAAARIQIPIEASGPTVGPALGSPPPLFDRTDLRPARTRSDFAPLAYGVNALILCLAILITACGPDPIGVGEGETSSESEAGDSSGETETGGETSTDTGGEPEPEPEPEVEGSTGDPGEGDAACDYLGCPCEAGGCVDLVCDLSEHCSLCSPGNPGCPCDPDGGCMVGQCFTGEDADGTSWAICYPADLLGCSLTPCPGDAYCTDGLSCAWPT